MVGIKIATENRTTEAVSEGFEFISKGSRWLIFNVNGGDVKWLNASWLNRYCGGLKMDLVGGWDGVMGNGVSNENRTGKDRNVDSDKRF